MLQLRHSHGRTTHFRAHAQAARTLPADRLPPCEPGRGVGKSKAPHRLGHPRRETARPKGPGQQTLPSLFPMRVARSPGNGPRCAGAPSPKGRSKTCCQGRLGAARPRTRPAASTTERAGCCGLNCSVGESHCMLRPGEGKPLTHTQSQETAPWPAEEEGPKARRLPRSMACSPCTSSKPRASPSTTRPGNAELYCWPRGAPTGCGPSLTAARPAAPGQQEESSVCCRQRRPCASSSRSGCCTAAWAAAHAAPRRHRQPTLPAQPRKRQPLLCTACCPGCGRSAAPSAWWCERALQPATRAAAACNGPLILPPLCEQGIQACSVVKRRGGPVRRAT